MSLTILLNNVFIKCKHISETVIASVVINVSTLAQKTILSIQVASSLLHVLPLKYH